jgi:HKD family nuclease
MLNALFPMDLGPSLEDVDPLALLSSMTINSIWLNTNLTTDSEEWQSCLRNSTKGKPKNSLNER